MSSESHMNSEYCEAATMKELYVMIARWQEENKKRMLSLAVDKCRGGLCCLAVTNPMEVVIVTPPGAGPGAKVDRGRLHVTTG